MRHASLLILPLTFSVAACGSDKGGSSPSTSTSSSDVTFTPPALEAGFTRLQPDGLKGIEPGQDVTHCQYAMAPVDHDVDIVDVTGGQSKYGHHIVAFSYSPPDGQAVGDEVNCAMGSEFTSGVTSAAAAGGAFLGGAGPIQGRVASLPAGVGFRLPKGQGVLLNTHYINTSSDVVDGGGYLDLKLAEVDPNRPVAALFINFNSNFDLAPNAEADSSIDCTVGSDVSVIMASNHMHEYGTHANTQVTRVAGTVDVVHDDPTWTEDMVNAPQFSRWTVDSPLTLHTGDTLRTSCSWSNTTASSMVFPREMCVGVMFAIATGDNPKAPSCLNGTWVKQGI